MGAFRHVRPDVPKLIKKVKKQRKKKRREKKRNEKKTKGKKPETAPDRLKIPWEASGELEEERRGDDERPERRKHTPENKK